MRDSALVIHQPRSNQELAETLLDISSRRAKVEVFGNRSKLSWSGLFWSGPRGPFDEALSTAALSEVLLYERDDLTVSVGAGKNFGELQRMLAAQGQMIALDPPGSETGTVGGVVAANLSGPMRRGFGTARDLVIGMTFATLEGKLVQSGGMVVKNVAGLDMAKLMIGSFGTLAVIASVNFRLHPMPENYATFLFIAPEPEAIFAKRNEILKGPLRPVAMDALNETAAFTGLRDCSLAVRAAGSEAVLARYGRELAGFSRRLSGAEEQRFWEEIREFPMRFLHGHGDGVVLRVSCPMSEMETFLRCAPGPVIARSASSVCYAYLTSWEQRHNILRVADERNWKCYLEAAGEQAWPMIELSRELPPVAQRIKRLFDPASLLNPARLYGRI